MSQTDVVKKILVTAGTHGNEMSGVEYLRNLQSNSQILAKLTPANSDLNVELALVNKLAIERCCRYVEEDLNRQFSQEKLSVLSGNNLEHQLAIEFNLSFGPKHEPTRDLVIDIHNTTSNMGPTIIILESDEFHQRMARYVKANMPEAIILVEDHIAYKEHRYLCTIGKRGVMIELGPQPQGVLRPEAYLQTEKMTQVILAFCEHWNQQTLTDMPPTEAFRLTREVLFPLNEDGTKRAMIHPERQNTDFSAMRLGSPAFLSFEGETINWDGEDNVYPHFIGESAYYHLNVAFALAIKTKL